MKNTSPTYRAIIRATALLLLMAFLVPSGQHARQLVDFCMTGMNHHAPAEMADDHSCCESEAPDQPTDGNQARHHNDCDWGLICACNIGQSHLGDKEWIPVSKDVEIILSESEDRTPFFSSGEPIPADHKIHIGEYSPPLWLLYDTFLN